MSVKIKDWLGLSKGERLRVLEYAVWEQKKKARLAERAKENI